MAQCCFAKEPSLDLSLIKQRGGLASLSDHRVSVTCYDRIEQHGVKPKNQGRQPSAERLVLWLVLYGSHKDGDNRDEKEEDANSDDCRSPSQVVPVRWKVKTQGKSVKFASISCDRPCPRTCSCDEQTYITSHNIHTTVNWAMLSQSPVSGGFSTKESYSSGGKIVKRRDMVNCSVALIILNST